MTAECVLGIVAGARASSISRMGEALGSVVEGPASIIAVWRSTRARPVGVDVLGCVRKPSVITALWRRLLSTGRLELVAKRDAYA